MADPTTSALVRVETTDTGERGREYRKGIWTLHETLVLIDAKKLDDERRMKGGDKEKTRTAELRWKWVENYCYKNECIRSQNQCNDKWDNLLRDYKKVREYQNRLVPDQPSYWQLEKHERKERGLPSNLLFEVYEALHGVVDKRYTPRIPHAHAYSDKSSIPPHQQQQQQQQQQTSSTNLPLPLPPPPPPPPEQQQQQTQPQIPTQQFPTSGRYPVDISESSESDESVVPHSPAKRRRVWRSTHGLAPAMSKSTVELTQTLMACEEKKDKRHRDLLGVEERKLHIEETKTEISRQGIAGLVSAVNNLANAILTLASDKNTTD
eukprot:Gb_09025 [translate_table: standard]